MENRQFTVDPSILFSIINAQAGTLPKALLEAVMNAIDAGAKKCVIALDGTSFTVKDDGRGFQSRKEIEDWFERFGTPHTEGDATYGRFRMGRGQLMAFAKTDWRTGEFSMEVDVKNNGLEYGLKSGLKATKGCEIKAELYKSMPAWELNDVLREFSELVKYAQIPISLNGKVVSKRPDSIKWDVETSEAWIKVDGSSELKVYNLGVLVRSFGAYKYGTGGEVVSKVPLQVNFARNDILISQCEVWRRIATAMKSASGTKTAKKASLTDSEREFLAQRIVTEEVTPSESLNARVITTVVGSQVSIYSLLTFKQMTLAPVKGDRLGERLHRSKTVFVISPETLERFRVGTLDELRALMLDRIPPHFLNSMPKAVPFSTVAQGYSKLYDVVDPSDTKPEELLAMKFMHKANQGMSAWLKTEMEAMNEARYQNASYRQLVLGQSDAALAWTDGSERITFDRKFLLKEAKKGITGWWRLLAVLIHEYCHLGEADLDGHSHPPEFFELYEALMTAPDNPVALIVASTAVAFANEAVVAGIRISRPTTGREKLASRNPPETVTETETTTVVIPPVRPAPSAARVNAKDSTPQASFSF